jgi:NAD(P)H-dependent FMN reductase
METSYLIISGTQRKDSRTFQISQCYQQSLQELGHTAAVVNLQDFPMSYYDINEKDPNFMAFQKSTIIPATKFIFVVPEYNGSIPGSLKMFMDNCVVKDCFWGKKAALVGLSEGRNGNLRGLDHLTGILHYLKINVLHYKVSLPQVSKLLNESNQLVDATTISNIQKQQLEFIAF